MKRIIILIAVLATASLICHSQVPTSGLVAWYPFNGNANDASGNGNNGTINGATLTSDRFGITSSALSFDGTNDEISVVVTTALQSFTAGNHSYSLWVNLTVTPEVPKFVIDAEVPTGAGGDQRGIRFLSTAKPVYKWVTYTSSFNAISSQSLSNGQWYHIVGVFENNVGKIYINSNLTGSASSNGTLSPITVMKIGNVSGGGTGDGYFNGKIDDIRLYNRALTASEIQQLYNENAGSTGNVSAAFVIDTKPPVVTLQSPNGGQSFQSNQPINVTWTATDDQPGINPVSIAFCGTQSGTTYQTLVQDMVNTGNQGVQPPLVSTAFGKFQVNVKDLFGNVGHDESNNYFSLTGGGVPVNVQLTNSQTGMAISGATVQCISGNLFYNALPALTPGYYQVGVPPGYGYVIQLTANGYQPSIIENLTFNNSGTYNLAYQLSPTNVYSDYRIVPVALAPNPTILEIPEGGIGYAWFAVEGYINGSWLPVPHIDLTAQDEQGQNIQCKTNILSYNFLTSGYHMQNAGVFSIKIPSNIVGNGSPGQQEVITVMTAAGMTLAPEKRQSIIAKIKPYTYSTSWGYRIFGKLGAGGTIGAVTGSGFIGGGSGSTMKISLSGLSSNPTWSVFQISRRGDIFLGVDFQLGPPLSIPFVKGKKPTAEVKVSFPYQTDYTFDMNNLPGLESLLAFYLFYEPGILFAGQQLSGGIINAAFLNWIVEAIIANSAQNGLGVSKTCDENGLDVSGSLKVDAAFGKSIAKLFKLQLKPSLGANVHVGGTVRKDTANTTTSSLYFSGGYDFNIGVGAKPAYKGPKLKFHHPFSFRTGAIPTTLDVELKGTYIEQNNTFKSFKLSSALESNAAAMNVNNLTGTKQKYSAWFDADNEYIKNLLYNISELPSEITNIGSTALEINAESNTFEDATTSFLEAVYNEQNNNLPAKLKYGVDAEAKNTFILDLNFAFPIPAFPAIVIKIGGGIETSHSTEYSISKGYWVKALPYLQTEMPNPPSPQITFSEAMGVLWSNVVSGQTLTELQNVILNHLLKKVIKWLGFKTTTQVIALNDDGSYLTINAQSIPPACDSLTCKHWKWDETQQTDRITDQNQKEQLTRYISGVKKLRAEASGLETGFGGYFKFEPSGYDFGDSTMITIKYPDSLVTNIDENKLAVFWEDTLGIWHYIPSIPNPDSNTVSAYVQHLTTYTVAPIKPNGQYDLHPSPDSIPANGTSVVTLTSDLLYNADSTLVPDSALFTVSSSRGTIMTADVEPNIEGIQVRTQSSTIQIQLKSDTTAQPISVLALSVEGYAKCATEVVLYDNTPPDPPVITSAIAVNNAVILKWDTVADVDLAGYRIYFDKDLPTPPYNGSASVWGSPSPVNVGLTNSHKLTGLGNDSTVYIAMTAFDISGNESDYSLPVEIMVSPPPLQLVIGNDTVLNGFDNCYSATQTITVAGNGTTFTVQSGGKATLIAGKSILMLPGAKVLQGGYLHGYITSDEQYCNLLDTTIAINPDQMPNIIGSPTNISKNQLFGVYPNPTSGNFNLVIMGHMDFRGAVVQTYDIYGRKVIPDVITNSSNNVMTLNNLPPGIYIIQVTIGNQVGTDKIVKR